MKLPLMLLYKKLSVFSRNYKTPVARGSVYLTLLVATL